MNIYLRIFPIILISALLWLPAGCNRNSDVQDRLDRAEALMESAPDSALLILEGIDPEFSGSRKDKARYALVMSQALDKNYIDTTTLDILQPAIDYYLKKGTPDEKLKTYYYQGRIFQNRGEYNSAIQSFMYGKEYKEATDTLTMANLMVAQATILYSTYRIDAFIENNLQSAKLYGAIGRKDYEMHTLTNALDGCIINNDKTRADSILRITRKLIEQNKDLSSYLAPYLLSYTVNFGNKNEILDMIHHYESIDSADNITKLNIAEAFCRIGDSYNSKYWLDAINLEPKTELETTLKYLAIKHDILELNGDIEGAYHAYKDFTFSLDSVHQAIFSNDLKFAKDHHAMEKSALLRIQKKDRQIWTSICIACILLVISGFFYHRYRIGQARLYIDKQEKQKLLLEHENLKKENDNLELERHNAMLEKQKAELECERRSLIEENLLDKIHQIENERVALKEILEEHQNLAKPIENAIKSRIDILNGLIASHIAGNEMYAKQYEELREQLFKNKNEFMETTRLAYKASHPHFIEYLEQHNLTDQEINYVCLYAMGLRGKEVGEYIKLKRHYNVSSQIRKKLEINEHDTNLGIYIRRIMKEMD